MTLNQVLIRIKQIVEAHKMVRSYEQQGLNPEFDNDHTKKCPSVNLIVEPGGIASANRLVTYGFKMMFEDLVNVAADTKTNEWDVVSDMAAIAEDINSQLLNPEYDDWRVSGDNSLEFLFENSNDMRAGVVLSFTIGKIYTQNICEVPSDLEIEPTPETMDKLLYDVKYVADGTEGVTLDTSIVGSSLEVVNGKKIVLITREMATLHRVSNLPDPAEFKYNDTLIGLGVPTNPGERFLILYRNY